MTDSPRRSERNGFLIPATVMGIVVLAGLSVIGGWYAGDRGKFSGAEAVGTANAVNTICDATKAAMQQEINNWKNSSDAWGQSAGTAFAQLTQIAMLGTSVVTSEPTSTVQATATLVDTPENQICFIATNTKTPRPYVPAATATDTATATRTATLTASATLPRPTNVNTEVSTQKPTDFVPTNTLAPSEVPTVAPSITPQTPEPTMTPQASLRKLWGMMASVFGRQSIVMEGVA